MNIQRFTAATSREALAKARMAFGDGTLILSNRQTENGVEVVATAEESLATLNPDAGADLPNGNRRAPFAQRAAEPLDYKDVASAVEDDANQLAMSTLSFQDYVRERMAKKRSEAAQAAQQAAAVRDEAPTRMQPRIIPADPPPKPKAAARAPEPAAPASAVAPSIARELQTMKAMIEDRFNTLNWLGQARHNPIQSNLMLRLIRAGYSPALARTILEKLPEGSDANEAKRWVIDVLERNLRTDAKSASLSEEGGAFALIGATGVGKTTTAAKLAGLCALRHGAASVGLISLDAYRVGAQEQLRAYGKMLGIVAHLAHDRAALQDLLGLLSNKKLVLIDTTGLAPHDPRKQEMLDLLDLPGIKRLLVLNAGAHGDTLEDTVAGYKGVGPQQVVLSKIDEAVKLGPALDTCIRHQLTLRGVTNGQRVPEDWDSADAVKLVRASLRSTAPSAYDATAADLGFLFSPVRSSENAEFLHA